MIDLAPNWQSFGLALRISRQRLDTIKAEPGIFPRACLSNTLSEFLRKNYDWEKHGEPSWRLIVMAIAYKAGGDNPSLAMEIAENHSTGTRKFETNHVPHVHSILVTSFPAVPVIITCMCAHPHGFMCTSSVYIIRVGSLPYYTCEGLGTRLHI